MTLDRAEILRSAHRAARARTAPSSSSRYGDRYDPETRGWVPKASYREIFASCLRSAWANAKFAAEEAAYEASLPPIPTDIAERIRELRAEAEFEPITMRGNDRYSALLTKARTLEEDARDAAIAARQLARADHLSA